MRRERDGEHAFFVSLCCKNRTSPVPRSFQSFTSFSQESDSQRKSFARLPQPAVRWLSATARGSVPRAHSLRKRIALDFRMHSGSVHLKEDILVLFHCLGLDLFQLHDRLEFNLHMQCTTQQAALGSERSCAELASERCDTPVPPPPARAHCLLPHPQRRARPSAKETERREKGGQDEDEDRWLWAEEVGESVRTGRSGVAARVRRGGSLQLAHGHLVLLSHIPHRRAERWVARAGCGRGGGAVCWGGGGGKSSARARAPRPTESLSLSLSLLSLFSLSLFFLSLSPLRSSPVATRPDLIVSLSSLPVLL